MNLKSSLILITFFHRMRSTVVISMVYCNFGHVYCSVNFNMDIKTKMWLYN